MRETHLPTRTLASEFPGPIIPIQSTVPYTPYLTPTYLLTVYLGTLPYLPEIGVLLHHLDFFVINDTAASRLFHA